MTRVAEGQEQLVQALQDRAASGQGGGDGMDAESRMRLRSIDVQMLRILEEISAGRQESMAELRTELGALTRALNNAARGAQMPVEPATRLNLKDPSATRKED
jgi:hypothetical protein